MKPLNLTHVITILFTAVSSIILSFANLHMLRILLSISVSLLVVVLVIKTSGFLRISYVTFFILSILLNIYYQIDFDAVLEAYNSYTLFIALFVFTPLIKIPIEAGNYIERLIPKLVDKSNDRLSPILVGSNFVLGSFINLGGIRVIGEIFSSYMKGSPVNFGNILSRPFCAAAFWTPYFSAFSVAVSYSGGTPLLILAIGLLFSILVLSTWITSMLIKRPREQSRIVFSRGDKHTVGILVIYFCLLVLSVVLLTHFTTMNVITIISLVSIFYNLLWYIAFGKVKFYLRALKSFASKDMLHIREEAFLFISIGFFANTLLNIGWELHFPIILDNSMIHVFLFILLFNIIVIAIAVTGVHHLVTITIISTAIAWENIGVVPVVYALMILLSWGISVMISPFSPANIITAQITRQPTFKVGIYHNGLFGVCVLIGGATYLTIVNRVLSSGFF